MRTKQDALPNMALLLYYRIMNIANFFSSVRWKVLGMSIGEDVQLGKIRSNAPNCVYLADHCEIRDNVSFWVKNAFTPHDNHITIGKNTFIGQNVEFNISGNIVIGNDCLIASSVIFVDSGHTCARSEKINTQSLAIDSIVVEDDVWIGSATIILKGVTIGKGAVVGANSLVNKDVLPYEIWVGSPAKKIGERQ